MPSPARPRISRSILAALLFGAASVGLLATAISAERTAAQARTQDDEAAAAAAAALREELTTTRSSFSGVDALAVDGEVSADEFTAFGSDVVRASGLEAVAYSRPVAEADRGSWESQTGLPLKQADGSGGLRPADARADHVAVVFTVPANESTTALRGLDLLGDPVRAAGVTGAGGADTTVMVAPIRLASSGKPGLFVVRAVRDRSGRAIGFVSSGMSLDGPIDRIRRASRIDQVQVAVDGLVMAGTAPGPATSSFQLEGRTFAVSAGSGRAAGWALPFALGTATVALFGGGLATTRLERRDRRRRERGHERAVRLRELAEALAGTSSTLAVMRIVADQAGAVMGASHTDVGRPSPTDAITLEVVHHAAADRDLAERLTRQDVDAPLPLTDCARSGATICVRDPVDHRARYPTTADEVAAMGIRAILCVPLGLGTDRSVGVIGFAFDHPLDDHQVDELTTVGDLVSQMTGRAYERAAVREIVEARVQHLSELTHALTTATTVDEVERAVAELLPPVLELVDAAVGVATGDATGNATGDDATGDDDAGGRGSGGDRTATVVRTYPSTTPGDPGLHLRVGAERIWTPTDERLAETVADLTEAALSRARLHDEQHAVLVRFQETLLTAPAHVDGFDVAVGYQPALGAIGMGGDWYSVIDAPGRVCAVVGDVVGHGPAAIAVMAEVKTILRHLLSGGTSIGDALDEADRSLRRRETFASATIVEIDKEHAVLRYVNAGHPPALLVTTEGTVRLDHRHRPWLGMAPSRVAPPSTVTFCPGDALVLYTDGLVEQRDEVIDVGIDRLADAIDVQASAAAIVDTVLADHAERRTRTTVDDDIAVVTVRRLADAG
ncbi:MAG: SpoIIE family protein phosphatase [Acidimicrobiales bacterium]